LPTPAFSQGHGATVKPGGTVPCTVSSGIKGRVSGLT